MFPNELPVKARNAGAAIDKGMSIDNFQGVRWFNELD